MQGSFARHSESGAREARSICGTESAQTQGAQTERRVMQDLTGTPPSRGNTTLSNARNGRVPLQPLDLAPWRLGPRSRAHAEPDPWRSLLDAHAATLAPRVLDEFDTAEDVVVIALPPDAPEDKLLVRRCTCGTPPGVEIWLGRHLVARVPGIERLSPQQITIITG